jgi:hypothetical protein
MPNTKCKVNHKLLSVIQSLACKSTEMMAGIAVESVQRQWKGFCRRYDVQAAELRQTHPNDR